MTQPPPKSRQPDLAIDIRNVSKTYIRQTPTGLKHRLIDWWRGTSQADFTRGTPVLENVSLRIPRGRSHGIVGRNGSGKSTLLKIIANILEPDAGTVRVNGRLCALLELGAGFHPELTGIENVYLYGSILGFQRGEIARRIPDIIALSGIGDAVEQPVRTYSSGMYLRLGFAVAIHAEPDVLLIDEVFAVGDAAFQKICKERVLELKERGTTILFVSHDMDAVCQLCDTATLLEGGTVLDEGSASHVADHYSRLLAQREMWQESEDEIDEPTAADLEAPTVLQEALRKAGQENSETATPPGQDDAATSTAPEVHVEDQMSGDPVRPADDTLIAIPREYVHALEEMERRHHVNVRPQRRFGNQQAQVERVHFVDASGSEVRGVATGEPLGIMITYSKTSADPVVIGIGIHTKEGIHIAGPNTRQADIILTASKGVLTYHIPALALHSGEYLLSVAIYDEEIVTPLDHCHKLFSLHVYPQTAREASGIIALGGSWEIHEGS